MRQLNNSLDIQKTVKRLLRQAAADALREEIDDKADKKRQEALRKMHELVDLASPPWQIERLGEDVATVSVTTCPQDSVSGEIMSRSGKNITFSRNGHSSDEFILFRSEHGVSVNHLINFRRCLKAVSRKLQAEGEDRINAICLDPTWNIADPLPIQEEMEKLGLYFSLALHFEILKPHADAYVFTTSSGREVRLSKHSDVTKSVKRFEAFEKLLDLDCEGSIDSGHFVEKVKAEISSRKQESQIHSFLTGLLTYQDTISKSLADMNDPRDRKQVEKELKSLQAFIKDTEEFLKETRQGKNGS